MCVCDAEALDEALGYLDVMNHERLVILTALDHLSKCTSTYVVFRRWPRGRQQRAVSPPTALSQPVRIQLHLADRSWDALLLTESRRESCSGGDHASSP